MISCALRSIMSKFTPTIYGKAANGEVYDGSDLRRTAEDDRVKNAFAADTISQGYDMARLKRISPEHGFDKMGEFMMFLRYLVSEHPDLARKKGRTSKAISQLLRSSRDAGTVESYMNNEILLGMAIPTIYPFVAVGSPGSEAINAELKRRFGGTPQIRGPVMKLKRRISQIDKLDSFVSAMYKKTTHQTKKHHVPARCIEKREIFSTTVERNGRCAEKNVGDSQTRIDFMKDRDGNSRRISPRK